MTEQQIDRDALREAREDLRKIAEGAPDYEGLYIAPSAALSILDQLDQAEARIKAVRDVLADYAPDPDVSSPVPANPIRRALSPP